MFLIKSNFYLNKSVFLKSVFFSVSLRSFLFSSCQLAMFCSDNDEIHICACVFLVFKLSDVNLLVSVLN